MKVSGVTEGGKRFEGETSEQVQVMDVIQEVDSGHATMARTFFCGHFRLLG